MKAVTQLATVCLIVHAMPVRVRGVCVWPFLSFVGCLIVHAMPVRVRDMLQHLLLTRKPRGPYSHRSGLCSQWYTI
jgi:hypothetical protein